MQALITVYVKQDNSTGWYTLKNVKVDLTDELILQIGNKFIDLKEKESMDKNKPLGLRDNGYVTPEKQADFLSRYGHLECIIDNVRYYTYQGQGFKVITLDSKVVQILKTSVEEVKKIANCSNLKFGGF